MERVGAKLFEVAVGAERHTIFECPERLPQAVGEAEGGTPDPFNLVVVDVSASMMWCWDVIMTSWNENVAPILKGFTKIFVFGDSVEFRRNGTFLSPDDMLNESTNLTGAIKRINLEIQESTHSFNRLYLVTDGAHNATSISPEVEISKLFIPKGKTVEVYLLGIGSSFPVEYSITIRSALHNGNSNVPSLFWAGGSDNEEGLNEDIHIHQCLEEEILNIANLSRKGYMKLQISPPGHLAPGFPNSSIAHLGEFIYFPLAANEIISSLKLSTEEGIQLELDIIQEDPDIQYLLDRVFRQWNSVLIQQHRNKEKVPMEAFEVMENIYTISFKKLRSTVEETGVSPNSIKGRLQKKKIKTLQTEFNTLMNQSKTIIGIEGKYESELELAKNILKTTVKSKHDLKNLKMKGYGLDDYGQDMKLFVEIYNKFKDKILSIPEPSVDDCCRVTLGSFIKDLQDPSFLDLVQEDKFTFMKTVSVTGIPVFAPIKDASQINPWTLVIKNILKSPFTIISQTALELKAEIINKNSSSLDKEMYLQEGDESTKFNVIVPVFLPEEANVIKPLVRTNIFSMLSTFCILKNPHIVDHNAHIAALGCTWMKIVTDYPKATRPEFVTKQLSLIEATGKIYMDRSSISKYLEILLREPSSAVMTECTLEDMEKPLKCESLIKPAFLLYLGREKSEVDSKINEILPLMIVELLGRCMSSNSNHLPEKSMYGITFVSEFDTEKSRKEWLKKKQEVTGSKILKAFIQEKGDLLESYFYVESLLKDLKSFCRDQLNQSKGSMYEIQVNMQMLRKLKSFSSAGNIQLNGLMAFAQEMGVPQDRIDEMFSEKKMLVYAFHALENKSSRDRMEKSIPSYEEALEQVKRKVAAESYKMMKIFICSKVLEEGKRLWTERFMSIHSSAVVRPMSPKEIVAAASLKKIEVNAENFSEVFKYNPKSGLMRNACMVEACPFYLDPRRTFNQHISAERQPDFPHTLHKVAMEVSSKGGNVSEIMDALKRGKDGKPRDSGDPLEAKLKQLEGQIGRLIIDYNQFVCLS